MPISLFSIIMSLNYYSEFWLIYNYCDTRNKCYSYCMTDNFPQLTCNDVKVHIEYHGNEYSNMFYYPNPHLAKSETEEFIDTDGNIVTKNSGAVMNYDICKSKIKLNKYFPFEQHNP